MSLLCILSTYKIYVQIDNFNFNTMKPTFKIFILITLLGYITGCSLENETDKRRDDEGKYLNQYITALTESIKNDTTVYDKTIHKSSSGFYYVIEKKESENDSLSLNNYIAINYTGWLLNSGKLGNVIETNDASIAKSAGIIPSVTIPGPYYMRYSYCNLIGGLFEGIGMMKKGSKFKLVIPSDLAYGGIYFGNIPSYSTLVYEIELVNIVINPKSYDSLKIELLKNKIGLMTKKDTLGSSIYYKENTAGSGKLIEIYDSVKFRYKASLIDERPIRSDFKDTTIIIGNKNLMPGIGLDFAFMQLKVGSKAEIIIPYSLSFGHFGLFNNSGQVVIPPCTSLLMDVEIEKIY